MLLLLFICKCIFFKLTKNLKSVRLINLNNNKYCKKEYNGLTISSKELNSSDIIYLSSELITNDIETKIFNNFINRLG